MAEVGLRKWLVTATVISASLLVLIDSTIVNVSLPDIMGNLGATIDTVSWVVTGYAVATVVVLPMSGWLGERFGQKNYFMFSIVAFTIFSFLSGNAGSLNELILFRILQGMAGGGLISTAQAILFQSWPPEQIGLASALFGLGAVVGPTVGPAIGGYLNDNFNWRWIFFVNIPVGAIATLCVSAFIRPMPRTGQGKPIDWWGIALLGISVGALQTMLEKGERNDWFSSTLIIALLCVAVIGGLLFLWRETTTQYPVVNFSLLRFKSFSIGLVTMFILGFGLFGSVFVFPILTQNILGFSAQQTGLILLPGGIVTMMMMPIIGISLRKGFPPYVFASFGLILFSVFCFMMIKYTTAVSGVWEFFWPLNIRGAGMAMLFVPITTMAVFDLRGSEIAQGTGLINMSQQLGGSFGIAAITTFLDRRMFFHRSNLIENINPYNSAFTERYNEIYHSMLGQGFSLNDAQMAAHQAIEGGIMQQTALLSYADIFWIIGIFFIIVIPILYLQKTKKAK